MLNNFYTYIHLRATDDVVFYVGHGNARRAYVINDRNIFWHRTVYKHGYYIKLVNTDLTKEEACEKEIELIKYYKEISGDKLTNLTEGGDGGMPGFSHSEASKKKIGAAAKGNQYGIANLNRKGTKHTEETKQKIKEKRALQVATWVGKHLSEETKEKLRVANIGKKQTPESNEKRRLTQTGRKRSAEDVAKTAIANTGKKRTPEQIERMKLAQLAVPRKINRTPEEQLELLAHRANMKREKRRLKNNLKRHD